MSVSTSYANALLAAAHESGVRGLELEAIESSLSSFEKLVATHKSLREVLVSPVTTAREKVAVVDSLAQHFPKDAAHGVLHRFLRVMADKGRLGQLMSVVDSFRRARLAADGAIEGTISAADPVDSKDIEGLAQAFSKKFGKKVVFQVSVDPQLLAGMKILINGTTYDGTLRAQLERLRGELAHVS